MLDAATQTAILAAILTLAPRLGLEPLFLQAMHEHETRDGQLVFVNADGSRDLGPLSVNEHTLPLMTGRSLLTGERWKTMPPERLVERLDVGVEAGARCFRWWLKYALFQECDLDVDSVTAWPVTMALDTPTRRRVLEHALARYNGGLAVGRDEAGRWENQESYVDPIMARWNELSGANAPDTEGDDGS